jgi:hypothetical protein
MDPDLALDPDPTPADPDPTPADPDPTPADPDPTPADPDPTPDQTPFFIDFKDEKIFFYNVPTGTSFQPKNFNFLLFQSLQHIYEKWEGSGSGSVLLAKGSGSRRPKNMRFLRIRFRIRIPNTGIRVSIEFQYETLFNIHT